MSDPMAGEFSAPEIANHHQRRRARAPVDSGPDAEDNRVVRPVPRLRRFVLGGPIGSPFTFFEGQTMRSLVFRALGGLVIAGIGLGVAATPAAAGDTTTFRLVTRGAVGYGTYEHRVSVPDRPVAPIRITGTLAGRGVFRCAVMQVARSGPADGIEWRTFGRHCGPGRTGFRVQASYLFRGVKPAVRLCSGRTVSQAERGRRCDLYQPPADR